MLFVKFGWELFTVKRQIAESERYQIIRLEEEEMKQKMEQDNQKIVVGGYSIYEDCTIRTKVAGRKTMLDVASLSFSSNVLFSSDVVLNNEDFDGCLLDEASMYALFGTLKVQGQSLFYRDREYKVRGLVALEEPILIIENEEKEEIVGNLVLDCSEEFYRDKYYQEYYYSYPYDDKYYYVADYASFLHWVETPNKWSDFSFFSDYGKRMKERWKGMVYQNKDVVEVQYYRIRLQSLMYELGMAISVFLLIITGNLYRKGRENS